MYLHVNVIICVFLCLFLSVNQDVDVKCWEREQIRTEQSGGGKIEVDGGAPMWRKCVGPRSCGDNPRDS